MVFTDRVGHEPQEQLVGAVLDHRVDNVEHLHHFRHWDTEVR